ncbi:MAG: hypothetical protein Q4G40_09925 [Brachybacterium sp.]|nr:hypothetical protein [Brachybacterium sp.]
MTGRLGPELKLEKGGTVSCTLNGIEDITVRAAKGSLEGVHRSWWSPWAGALVVTHQTGDRETPIAAGPIVRPISQDRAKGAVEITAKGIGEILDRRIVLAGDYRPGQEDELRASQVVMRGGDLGTYVARIIDAATSKRAGSLPIVLPAGRRGSRERTYEGWNVANNQAWNRISQITEVRGGPDVAFRPRWAEGREFAHVEWELATGSEAQPTLPQNRVPVWDATANDSTVASMSIVSTADELAHRVYATGAGEGAGIALRMAEQATLPEHFPLLEDVVTDSDTENTALLLERARGRLTTQATDQVSLGVHSSDLAPFGTWHVGDAVDVECAGWLQVPDGTHRLRIVAARYTLGSDIAQVECQEDILGEELTW